MRHENDHSACVDAWMDRTAQDLPPAQLLGLFELGFAAMWGRALVTLGDITLVAIVDRVLHSAAEQFPVLGALEVEPDGLQSHALREQLATLPRDQFAEGLRFVLVEFLTVLGNLTAEILTPALHSELSKVAPEGRGPVQKESRGRPPNPESNDEDARS